MSGSGAGCCCCCEPDGDVVGADVLSIIVALAISGFCTCIGMGVGGDELEDDNQREKMDMREEVEEGTSYLLWKGGKRKAVRYLSGDWLHDKLIS